MRMLLTLLDIPEGVREGAAGDGADQTHAVTENVQHVSVDAVGDLSHDGYTLNSVAAAIEIPLQCPNPEHTMADRQTE